MERPQYIYDIDDRPPFKLMVIYALQWAMIIFPAILPFAIIPARVLNLGPAEEVRFLQLTLLVTGFFTSVQCLWGHRYPVIDGPSTALLLTFLVIAPYGLPAVQAGAMLGGLLLMAAVLVIKPGRLIAVMTPNVVGVILMLIGLNLLPYLSPLMTGMGSPEGGSAARLVVSLALILIMATVAYRLRGFFKSIWLLLGMTVGSALFFLIEHPSLEHLLRADWFSYPARIVPSQPEFTLSSLIAFAVSYVAVVVNSVGSIQAIANITSDERLPRALPRCLFLNGIAGVVSGAMGITGMVSYSMSPGIVLSNRVASRYAVACCGVMVMLAAFMP
ncbi:MAG: purine/pyrimidine permease, partial [Desulfobacteraceae bacterium]|nr:purine/pyrimidine permease [Desulfobacteraceae bacterium]